MVDFPPCPWTNDGAKCCCSSVPDSKIYTCSAEKENTPNPRNVRCLPQVMILSWIFITDVIFERPFTTTRFTQVFSGKKKQTNKTPLGIYFAQKQNKTKQKTKNKQTKKKNQKKKKKKKTSPIWSSPSWPPYFQPSRLGRFHRVEVFYHCNLYFKPPWGAGLGKGGNVRF